MTLQTLADLQPHENEYWSFWRWGLSWGAKLHLVLGGGTACNTAGGWVLDDPKMAEHLIRAASDPATLICKHCAHYAEAHGVRPSTI